MSCFYSFKRSEHKYDMIDCKVFPCFICAYFKVGQFCVQPKGFNVKLESVRKQIDLDTNTSIRKYINRTQKLRLIMCDKSYSIIQWLSFCICHRPNLYLSQNRIVFVTEKLVFVTKQIFVFVTEQIWAVQQRNLLGLRSASRANWVSFLF